MVRLMNEMAETACSQDNEDEDDDSPDSDKENAAGFEKDDLKGEGAGNPPGKVTLP